jgi:hypothetical protein
VKTEFEGHSKTRTASHPAYAAPDTPARILEAYVNKGIKAGAGAGAGTGMIEPDAVAETIWGLASKEGKAPLRLPLGKVAWTMKRRFKGSLAELQGIKDVSFMGKEG